MSIGTDCKPHLCRCEMRALVVAAATVFLLCIARIAFCAAAPEVLSGQAGLRTDVSMVLLVVPMVALGAYLAARRRSPAWVLILLVPAFYILGGAAGLRTQMILFHVGHPFRLIDADLAAWDAAMGFGWSAYFDWLVSRPTLHGLLTQAYHSIWVQPLILTVLFIATRRVIDYGRLQVALPLSFALVCVVATLLPALGAYQFHGMSPDRHPGVTLAFSDGMTAPMLWLRQAALPATMPEFPDLRVITFPSWHAAAAVIFSLSAWPLPRVRWLALAVNALMLAATPVQGSHYLSDMIIGATLGGLAYAAAARLLAAGPAAGRDRATAPAPQAPAVRTGA